MINQLVRFSPALRLLDQVGGGELLEVGSGSRGLAPWLGGGWRVTAVDRSFDDYGTIGGPRMGAARTVQADARALPFPDGSFDAVVCLDMLEHVPREDRPRVLAELARTARTRLIVGCPTGAAALAADRQLADVYRASGQPLPPWLAEHLENGFPEPEELAAGLSGAGALRLLPNESVAAHSRLMRFEATPRGLRATLALTRLLSPGLRRPGRRWSEFVLKAIRGLDRRPSYRTLAVLDVGPSGR